MDLEYIAHKDGERTQSIKEHLFGTAQLAKQFSEVFGNGDWGYCCGMLHDIGKYSAEFQEKIKNDTDRRVDHSTAGAQLCMEQGGFYSLMSYCIAGHHAGLPDYGNRLDTADAPTLMGRCKKKVKDYSTFCREISVPDVTSQPFDPDKGTDFDFSLSVFIRMLFSCLVDADFLDTEKFMNAGQSKRDAGERMEVLLSKLETYVADWLQEKAWDTVNGRRTEILKSCLENGRMEKGLFRLTVPTGGGKTIASLAFALRHAVNYHMDRVIYVIPYTSIIEQNADVFRRILGDENVLEHHCGVEFSDSEEWNPMRLAAENWDKPVVVTTNVQFFESLFASRSSQCRKLHNIANSVIIFDEAQMLPNDYLKPCVSMMEELMTNYGTSMVLCTATQPALTSFFPKERQIRELCPRREEQFRFFKRVTFQHIGRISEEELVQRLQGQQQVLCIVNTKKRAQAVYDRIKGEGVYHLSTAMYPRHRRRILSIVKNRLETGKPCILISTSLVEAGVDLDFQSVYRQLSGIDSMIQAAGRCNREGKRSAEESRMTIFQFQDGESVPGQRQQMDVAKYLLDQKAPVEALETVEQYFETLYHLRGDSLDKKRIMEEFKNRQYNFAKTAKEFHLIEKEMKTLFIPKEAEAEQLLHQIQIQGYTKSGMRRASQYCIQIYEEEWERLNGAGMVRPVSENASNFYVLTELQKYTEDKGFHLNIDSGVALFM